MCLNYVLILNVKDSDHMLRIKIPYFGGGAGALQAAVLQIWTLCRALKCKYDILIYLYTSQTVSPPLILPNTSQSMLWSDERLMQHCYFSNTRATYNMLKKLFEKLTGKLSLWASL